ncbi:MAG: hypothetical protein F6K40_26755 [Okeania sp. SIO3I5]|uniref:hypothetical protein n=1 Tax=Okeania sp. SIO3I5 TaxID=2607805 RepID=UPI0013B8FB5D|nr:hypothetical protein [Okeania sp. SIO3I5]NEQ39656.1 hypothetical protein [Okeania sp. SIO3I5]
MLKIVVRASCPRRVYLITTGSTIYEKDSRNYANNSTLQNESTKQFICDAESCLK